MMRLYEVSYQLPTSTGCVLVRDKDTFTMREQAQCCFIPISPSLPLPPQVRRAPLCSPVRRSRHLIGQPGVV